MRLPYIRKLKEYSHNGVSVYLVNGFWIRNNLYIDYTQGGHGYIYKFIPKSEIWIDNSIRATEREYVILHEKIERTLMKRGASYNSAHKIASEVEINARRGGL